MKAAATAIKKLYKQNWIDSMMVWVFNVYATDKFIIKLTNLKTKKKKTLDI